MEIPDNLKHLYKHWKHHTVKLYVNTNIVYNKDLLDQIHIFVSERMKIWNKKQQNHKHPLTNDPVLAQFRFCNIYRELDKQTIQIHTLLKDLEKDFDLWLLNLIFCRMVCNPETINGVGFLSYDIKSNTNVYNKLVNLQKPKYGSAYIFPISLLSKIQQKTREEFFCFYLPNVTKQCAARIKKFNRLSVVEALRQILPIFGLNFKFHWTEVLIDIAYQYPEYIDLFKEFPIGPGSTPTMKRLSSHTDLVQTNLGLLSHDITHSMKNFPYLTFEGKNVWLSAENWEGIGCEFRKYTNLQEGNGRKRKFTQETL